MSVSVSVSLSVFVSVSVSMSVSVSVSVSVSEKSQRKLLTCVQLAFRLVTHLRRLALTWSNSNSYASRCKFFTVSPPNVSRHKLIAKSSAYVHCICVSMCFCLSTLCDVSVSVRLTVRFARDNVFLFVHVSVMCPCLSVSLFVSMSMFGSHVTMCSCLFTCP